MTAPRRTSGGPPPASSAVVRGAVLVFVAVVLGLGLLAKGFPGGGGGGGGGGTNQSTTSTTSGTGSSTSSTVAAPHEPAQVKVWVLNGSGLVGVAGQATDTLHGKSYTTIPPQNAPAKVAATVIYYTAGYIADAQAIAADLGTAASAVKPLPAAGTAPAVPADIQAANVVVVLGPDFKSG